MKTIPPLESREAVCERFFAQIDSLIGKHGVEDAGTARIEGFPEFRVNRFLASLANSNLTGEPYAFWLEHLRKLDETARLVELRNVPPDSAAQLQAYTPSSLPVEEAIIDCGHQLSRRDGMFPVRHSQLMAHATVPDAYSNWQRTLGFYVLTRLGVVEGIYRLHRELRNPFVFPRQSLPIEGHLIRYSPPAPVSLAPARVAEILKEAAANPLGIPEPSQDQLNQLFVTFAPVWAIDTQSDADRIGSARMGQDGEAQIDVVRPPTYRYVSYAHIGGQVLLQLNYIIWFPARPPDGALDIYAGRFDGLIWRVTLTADGKPLAYDSIHSCGCYYQIFPGEGFKVIQPQDGSEPVLSPMPIQPLKLGERLIIRLDSRIHFIRGVTLERDTQGTTVYGWRDYDDLRSLPMPNGTYRSMFAADGLVSGSERPERFLFWPMGVPSAGAMRQWGTHAIAFLSRRHFDDPQLFEKLLRPLRE